MWATQREGLLEMVPGGGAGNPWFGWARHLRDRRGIRYAGTIKRWGRRSFLERGMAKVIVAVFGQDECTGPLSARGRPATRQGEDMVLKAGGGSRNDGPPTGAFRSIEHAGVSSCQGLFRRSNLWLNGLCPYLIVGGC